MSNTLPVARAIPEPTHAQADHLDRSAFLHLAEDCRELSTKILPSLDWHTRKAVKCMPDGMAILKYVTGCVWSRHEVSLRSIEADAVTLARDHTLSPPPRLPSASKEFLAADAVDWLSGLETWAERAGPPTARSAESPPCRSGHQPLIPLDVFTEGEHRGLVVNGVQNKELKVPPIVHKVIAKLLPAVHGREVAITTVREKAGVGESKNEEAAAAWPKNMKGKLNNALGAVVAGFTVEVVTDASGDKCFRWMKDPDGIREKNPHDS